MMKLPHPQDGGERSRLLKWQVVAQEVREAMNPNEPTLLASAANAKVIFGERGATINALERVRSPASDV